MRKNNKNQKGNHIYKNFENFKNLIFKQKL